MRQVVIMPAYICKATIRNKTAFFSKKYIPFCGDFYDSVLFGFCISYPILFQFSLNSLSFSHFSSFISRLSFRISKLAWAQEQEKERLEESAQMAQQKQIEENEQEQLDEIKQIKQTKAQEKAQVNH